MQVQTPKSDSRMETLTSSSVAMDWGKQINKQFWAFRGPHMTVRHTFYMVWHDTKSPREVQGRAGSSIC